MFHCASSKTSADAKALGKLKISLAALQWSRSRDWNMSELQQESPCSVTLWKQMILKWSTTQLTLRLAWDELDGITEHTSRNSNRGKLQTIPPSVANIVSIICFCSKFALKTYSKGKKEMKSNGKKYSKDILHIKTAAIKLSTSTPSVLKCFYFTDLMRT